MNVDWGAIAAIATVAGFGLAFGGFWLKFGSRLANAEATSHEAKEDAKEANEKATLLSASFSLYREQIAREYIHREVMREVEDRLTQAIERLGDRLDRVLERSGIK